MVCFMCLLPLFLVPIVNLFPILFDYIMVRVYRLLGWEYVSPLRDPPACPIKSSATKTNTNDSVTGEQNHHVAAPGSSLSSDSADDVKKD